MDKITKAMRGIELLDAFQGYKFIDKEMAREFGLPESTTSFTLHANMNDVVRIDCSYIANEGQCETAKKRLKKFVLHEVEDVEIKEQDDGE